MGRPVAIVLLIVGIVLIGLGINASNSFSSEVSEAFTGNPSNNAIWFFLSGLVLTVIGGAKVLKAS